MQATGVTLARFPRRLMPSVRLFKLHHMHGWKNVA
jgi:hypothetical protein